MLSSTYRETVPTELISNERDLSWDAGIWRWASIGDVVWHDLDGDGTQDPAEPGINGVTVRLLDSSGAVVATTTTAANPVGGAPGWYLFDDLVPDQLLGASSISPARCWCRLVTWPPVSTTAPTTRSIPTQAARRAARSRRSSPRTRTIRAGTPASTSRSTWATTSGTTPTSTACSMRPTPIPPPRPSRASTVSSSEPARRCRQRGRHDNDGRQSRRRATQAGTVRRSAAPARTRSSSSFRAVSPSAPQNVGADDTVDSDASPTTGRTGTFVLTSGNDDFTWDAGSTSTPDSATSSGTTSTPTASRIPASRVSMASPCGCASGRHRDRLDHHRCGRRCLRLFESTRPRHVLGALRPRQRRGRRARASSRARLDVGLDQFDSDAERGRHPRRNHGARCSTEFDPTIDAGFYTPASIGDFVWDDLDGDGIQDPGEPGIGNVDGLPARRRRRSHRRRTRWVRVDHDR